MPNLAEQQQANAPSQQQQIPTRTERLLKAQQLTPEQYASQQQAILQAEEVAKAQEKYDRYAQAYESAMRRVSQTTGKMREHNEQQAEKYKELRDEWSRALQKVKQGYTYDSARNVVNANIKQPSQYQIDQAKKQQMSLTIIPTSAPNVQPFRTETYTFEGKPVENTNAITTEDFKKALNGELPESLTLQGKSQSVSPLEKEKNWITKIYESDAVQSRLKAIEYLIMPFASHEQQKQKESYEGKGWVYPDVLMQEKANSTTHYAGTIQKEFPKFDMQGKIITQLSAKLEKATPIGQAYTQEVNQKVFEVQQVIDAETDTYSRQIIEKLTPEYQEKIDKAKTQAEADAINKEFGQEVITEFNKEYKIPLENQAKSILQPFEESITKKYEERAMSEMTYARILDIEYQVLPSFITGTLIGADVTALSMARPVLARNLGIAGIGLTAVGVGFHIPQIAKEFRYSAGAGIREIALTTGEIAVPLIAGSYGAKLTGEAFVKTGKITGEKGYFEIQTQKGGQVIASKDGYMKLASKDLLETQNAIYKGVQRITYETPKDLRVLGLVKAETFDVTRTIYAPNVITKFTSVEKPIYKDNVFMGFEQQEDTLFMARKTPYTTLVGQETAPRYATILEVKSPVYIQDVLGKMQTLSANEVKSIGLQTGIAYPLDQEGKVVLGTMMGELGKEPTSLIAITQPRTASIEFVWGDATKEFENQYIQLGLRSYGAISEGGQKPTFPYEYFLKKNDDEFYMTMGKTTTPFMKSFSTIEPKEVSLKLPSIPKGQFGNHPTAELLKSMEDIDTRFTTNIFEKSSYKSIEDEILLASGGSAMAGFTGAIPIEAHVNKLFPVLIPRTHPFLTPRISPTIMPRETSFLMPKLTPSLTPKIINTIIPIITPTVIPKITPIIIPEITPNITPNITPKFTFNIPNPFSENRELTKKLRKKIKYFNIKALLPDFTAISLGLKPQKFKPTDMKKMMRAINKVQTGFEVRTGGRITGLSDKQERKLMRGLL